MGGDTSQIMQRHLTEFFNHTGGGQPEFFMVFNFYRPKSQKVHFTTFRHPSRVASRILIFDEGWNVPVGNLCRNPRSKHKDGNFHQELKSL